MQEIFSSRSTVQKCICYQQKLVRRNLKNLNNIIWEVLQSICFKPCKIFSEVNWKHVVHYIVLYIGFLPRRTSHFFYGYFLFLPRKLLVSRFTSGRVQTERGCHFSYKIFYILTWLLTFSMMSVYMFLYIYCSLYTSSWV